MLRGLAAAGREETRPPPHGAEQRRGEDRESRPRRQCRSAVQEGDGDYGEDQATATTGASIDHSSAGAGDAPSAGQAGPRRAGSMMPLV